MCSGSVIAPLPKDFQDMIKVLRKAAKPVAPVVPPPRKRDADKVADRGWRR